MATFTISPTGSNITFNGTTEGVSAGDTIEIDGDDFGNNKITFQDLTGTSGSHITIINSGGQTLFRNEGSETIQFEDCVWVDMFGTGSIHTYGFLCHNKFRVLDGCSNMHFKRIEIEGQGFSSNAGFNLKQITGTASIDDITFEECKVTGVAGEAFYLGSTRTDSPLDSEDQITNITMLNCYAEDCAEGYQLSSCVSGGVIDGCVARNMNPEIEADSSYSSAIVINKGSEDTIVRNCRVWGCDGNGLVINSTADLSGTATSKTITIENNIIENTATGTTSGMDSAIRKFSGVDPSVTIQQNTLVRGGNSTVPEGKGIRGNDNITYECNIAVGFETDAYDVGGTGNTEANNLSQVAGQSEDGVAYTVSTIKFVDDLNEDFRLQSDSPALVANNGSLTCAVGYAGALGTGGGGEEEEGEEGEDLRGSAVIWQKLNWGRARIRYYIYDNDGELLDDPDKTTECLFNVSWGSMWPKGYGTFTATIRRDYSRAWLIKPGYRIVAMDGLTSVYDGRLESPKINSESGRTDITLTAHGWYVILNERRLRKRWYDKTPVKRFVWPSGTKDTTDQELPIVEKRDKDEVFRLAMAPDDTQLDNTNYYQEQYFAPTGFVINVDYNIFYRTGDGFDVTIWNDDDNSGEGTFNYLSTVASSTSESVAVNNADTQSITIRIGPDTVPPGADLYDQNDWVAFNSFEIKCSLHSSHSNSGTPVYSMAELVEDVLLYVRGTDISADMGDIDGDTTALNGYITPNDSWETASSIIEDLASYSDISQNTYGLAIWDGDGASDGLPQAVFSTFTISSSQLDYLFSLSDLYTFSIEESVSEIFNWVIVKFVDENGITQYVTPDDDASLKNTTSITDYGEKHALLDVGEATQADAIQYGERYLSFHSTRSQNAILVGAMLKGSFSVRGNGACRLRAGDLINIRFPDRQHTIFVRECRYDVNTDTATLTPEIPPDQIEIELGQIAGKGEFNK